MFVQIGPNRWADRAYAARAGLRPYHPPAAPSPPRAAAARGKTPASRSTSRVADTRPDPRDIAEAMQRGMANDEIETLIARGVLRRPRLPEAIRTWPMDAPREALRRGLVW